MPQLLDKPAVGLSRLRELCDTLESHEDILQGFFYLTPDLLAVINDDGSFLQTNPSWQKLLGWTEGAIGETPWLYLIHPDDRMLIQEATNQLAAHDLSRLACRILHADGSYRTVEFSATKWRNGTSNLIGRLVNRRSRELSRD